MRGTLTEGLRALRLGKKPGMRRGVLSLLAAVTLFCLGIFLLSLVATTLSEAPFGAAGAQVGLLDGEAFSPLAEYQSHPLVLADEARETDERPVNASVLTMLVVAGACSGVSIFLWLATTGALRRGAIRPSWGAEGDRRWSGGAHDGLSFLGVFLL
jgi:hypothetical protein